MVNGRRYAVNSRRVDFTIGVLPHLRERAQDLERWDDEDPPRAKIASERDASCPAENANQPHGRIRRVLKMEKPHRNEPGEAGRPGRSDQARDRADDGELGEM